MNSTKFFEGIVFYVLTFPISGSIITTWIIMFGLFLFSIITYWKLKKAPLKYQTGIENIVAAIESTIENIIPGKVEIVFPFICTLWIFIFCANLIGLIPGFSSPTADLSITASLAIIVFMSVHWFGVKIMGLRNYLKHYVSPNPVLLPFHLISELSRTLALAIRLFGNVMSLEVAAALILLVAGFLVPIPLLMLHIVEAIIQTYLFGMLALIYIAGGIQAQELQQQKKGIQNE